MHARRADHRKTHPDSAIAAVAARQRGVISLAQLRDIGLGRGAIGHRLATGRLHRLHSGVYLVGHPAPAPLARETAALLSCGRGAVLSHRSAAAIWGFMKPPAGPVDVTVVGRDCGPRAGIRHRRTSSIDTRDVRRREGLLVTAPARTLLDVSGAVEARALERGINEALVLKLTSHEELRAAMRRSKGRPGAPALRRLLDQAEGPTFTRSEAEDRLLRLLRKAGLSQPETNVEFGPYELDMLWRSAKLAVEVDGYAFHSTRAAFERDRIRDADLQAQGLRVLRLTWRQIADRPEAAIARIAQLLHEPA